MNFNDLLLGMVLVGILFALLIDTLKYIAINVNNVLQYLTARVNTVSNVTPTKTLTVVRSLNVSTATLLSNLDHGREICAQHNVKIHVRILNVQSVLRALTIGRITQYQYQYNFKHYLEFRKHIYFIIKSSHHSNNCISRVVPCCIAENNDINVLKDLLYYGNRSVCSFSVTFEKTLATNDKSIGYRPGKQLTANLQLDNCVTTKSNLVKPHEEDAKSKVKLQSQMKKILKKHDINAITEVSKAYEMLDIALDHDCHCLVRNLETGDDLHVVTASNQIKHEISFDTKQTFKYFIDKSMSCVLSKSKTTITFSGEVKDEQLDHYVSRHMVQIPRISVVYSVYDIQIPQPVAAVIGDFLNGEVGEEFEMYGVCYPHLAGKHSIVSNSVSSNDHDSSPENIYDSYITNEKGDIEISFTHQYHNAEQRAFIKYYQGMIDTQNKAIRKYLKENKFYKITVMRKKAIIVFRPCIKHYLIRNGFGNVHYQIRTTFGGFNNLNLNEPVNDENTMIESTEFGIDWRRTYCIKTKASSSHELEDITNSVRTFNNDTISIYSFIHYLQSFERDCRQLYTTTWNNTIRDEITI